MKQNVPDKTFYHFLVGTPLLPVKSREVGKLCESQILFLNREWLSPLKV